MPEFAFVQGLTSTMPKREKSRYEQMMERYKQVREVVERKGMIVPAQLGAKILGVSRQRLDELIGEGRIERIDLDSHVYVTEDTLLAYAQSERKTGRPSKFVEEVGTKGVIRAAINLGRQVVKEARQAR